VFSIYRWFSSWAAYITIPGNNKCQRWMFFLELNLDLDPRLLSTAVTTTAPLHASETLNHNSTGYSTGPNQEQWGKNNGVSFPEYSVKRILVVPFKTRNDWVLEFQIGEDRPWDESKTSKYSRCIGAKGTSTCAKTWGRENMGFRVVDNGRLSQRISVDSRDLGRKYFQISTDEGYSSTGTQR